MLEIFSESCIIIGCNNNQQPQICFFTNTGYFPRIQETSAKDSPNYNYNKCKLKGPKKNISILHIRILKFGCVVHVATRGVRTISFAFKIEAIDVLD
jgi:hypothetical protein